MVRSLFIASVLALSAVVSAVTPLVGRALIDADFHHVGTGDIDTGDILDNGVQVNELTVDNVLNGLSILGGGRIREHGIDGGDFGDGFGDGFGDYDLGESDYGHDSFELSDGDIDGDIDADFDDIIGDGGDCGGDCGSGCGGGRRRHPRIPHRVGRIGGGCN